MPPRLLHWGQRMYIVPVPAWTAECTAEWLIRRMCAMGRAPSFSYLTHVHPGRSGPPGGGGRPDRGRAGAIGRLG